jgi:hypothetical protein
VIRPARSRVSSTLIDAAGYPSASWVAPLLARRTTYGAVPSAEGSWTANLTVFAAALPAPRVNP